MGIDGTGIKVSLRKAYAEALIEIGKKRKDIVVLDADLAKSTQTASFGEVFPERFLDMGVSEADMIDTAVGIASTGKTVFCSTFAIFATGKPWEQIRNSAAYSGFNIKIVASHSGISVGEDGASHQCIEDIALLRIIPKTTIVAPADAVATKKLLFEIAETPGLCYMRLTRPSLPIVYTEDEKFKIGKGKVLKKGKEILIVATGSMVYHSLNASKILEKEGISSTVIDMHTIKPIDEEVLITHASNKKLVITVEEHSIIGGLGSAVCEVLSEKSPVRIKRIGIEDRFGESGSYQELYKYFGLTPEAISQRIKMWL